MFLFPFITNISPVSSANFIASAWTKAGLPASGQKGLPGRVTVFAPDSRTFMRALPPSHADCVRSWMFVPPEDLPTRLLFGQPTFATPSWYTIQKRGKYYGDLGYALSCDEESSVVHILVASRYLADPNRRRGDDNICQDNHARRLFSPEKYPSIKCRRVRGLLSFKHKRHTYVSGLLLMKLPMSQVRQLASPPTPQQIMLHIHSAINPVFMAATLTQYHQQFWQPGDRVVVDNAVHHSRQGFLVSIDHENRSADVELFDGTNTVVSLLDVVRSFAPGDSVRIVYDPHSDPTSVHHKNMGKFGFVTMVDCETRETTFLDPTGEEVSVLVRSYDIAHHTSQIRAPPFLLESYVPDQQILIPNSIVTPQVPSPGESSDVIQIGDTAGIVSGPHIGVSGIVETVQRTSGMICMLTYSFHSAKELSGTTVPPPRRIDVPISSVTFQPPLNALRFSVERGYNVKRGDSVVVVRGESRGRNGVVCKVNLDNKTLSVLTCNEVYFHQVLVCTVFIDYSL